MEWNDLRFFLAVSKAGSLIGAARLLNSSQPTVGRRIRAMEQSLGQKLFQRGAEGFVLTDEGEQVRRYAERIAADIDAMERTLAGQQQEVAGQLRVSSSDWFGVCVLAQYIADFSVQYPKVKVELITDARTLSLTRREADLVFRIVPFDDPDIAQRQVVTMPYAVYATVAHKLGSNSKGRGLSLITMDSQFSELPDSLWIQQRLPEASVVFTSNNRQAQASYCLGSEALAVLPTALGDSIPELVRLDLGEAPPSRTVWLGYHTDLRSLSRLRVLIDYVSERLSQDPRFLAAGDDLQQS